jgi:hypothetical protein
MRALTILRKTTAVWLGPVIVTSLIAIDLRHTHKWKTGQLSQQAYILAPAPPKKVQSIDVKV